MIVIKLGGSVITDKRTEGKIRKRIIDRLIWEIKKSGEKFSIVHGAGSFGHIPAERYQLHRGLKEKSQLEGFHLTHHSVRLLNSEVMKVLLKHHIPSVSISPLCFIEMRDRRIESIDLSRFDKALSMGLTPVSFGDVVFDSKRGFSICSGDDIVLYLALHFKPDKVVFIMDEDGIFDRDPKKYRNAKFLKDVRVDDLPSAEESSYIDVTGGMKKKLDVIKRIANNGIDVYVVNGNKIGRVYGVLAGKKVKRTHIIGC
ncbi:MAG: kinase [Thermotogae bacterium]|nr:MAG: kinase [Thermotogota bacterium]